MIVADLNKMTIEELEAANLKYGVTLLINDGKIIATEIQKNNSKNEGGITHA